jgi:hypothetical protein
MTQSSGNAKQVVYLNTVTRRSSPSATVKGRIPWFIPADVSAANTPLVEGVTPDA